MSKRFHHKLVHDYFGDPGLYLDCIFEKRAFLFDLGDLGPLSNRKLLRITDLFVSHMHMDHFSGFARLLRVHLGRDRSVRLFGPEGLIDAVSDQLAAYTWNLVENYEADLSFRVSELRDDNRVRSATFRCRDQFRPDLVREIPHTDDQLYCEADLCVRTRVLDHGIPRERCGPLHREPFPARRRVPCPATMPSHRALGRRDCARRRRPATCHVSLFPT